MAGARPIVDFMMVDFILDAMGEIINQMAKMQYMSSGRIKMPIVLRGSIGIGKSAATHHSGSYYSIFANVPGLRVVVPTTPYDAKGLFKTAIRSDDPVIFLEHKLLLNNKGPVPEEEYLIPFGQAAISREGKDVTVVAIAAMVQEALAAADTLAKQGVAVEVIDPRTVSPLDIDSLDLEPLSTGGTIVWLRLAGLKSALPARIDRVRSTIGGGEVIDDDQLLWHEVRELKWLPASRSTGSNWWPTAR